MKRIMLSVFAAAITAAWVVPASAADVTFSGQYRVRGEYRDNANFDDRGTQTDTASFIESRVRLTANAKATEDTSVKITLQDTRTWGKFQATTGAGGPNLTDDGQNSLDLHESYVNIEKLFGAPLTLRVGRQELAYGDERLIGAFGWSNNGRSFDAIKLMYTSEPVNVDLFASKIIENNSTGVRPDNDQDFYGIYATTKVIPNNTLDLYALLLRDGSVNQFIANNTGAIAGIDEVQNLYTVGARLKGAIMGLDYTAELPYQFGKINTTGTDYDISAWAFAAKVGYTLPTPIKVRVGAEYDFASGDDNSGDADIKTFSNLFPTNHDKLGYMDQQAWRNVSAWNINASADVTEKLRLYAAYWSFDLAEKQDGWYSAANWNNAASGIRAANASNNEDSVGSEIDVVATYKYNNNVTIEGGYGRFFTGDFIESQINAAGGDKADQDWAYLMLTANF